MRHSTLRRWQALLLVSAVTSILGQEPPPADINHTPRPANINTPSAAAIAGSKQDPAAYERGTKMFATYCAGCHGASGRGGPGAPDLIRSLLVLDDEKGILIAPVIREGRPDKGMPRLGLSEGQISDIVAWLHVQTYSAGHRTTYLFKDVVTGDPKKGETYFKTTGGCSSCHSATGDLAGIASKYDPFALQARWLQPRNARRTGNNRASASDTTDKMKPTVTVTLPSGQSFSGTLDGIDDFTVSLRDDHNQFHSFTRDGDSPKVVVHDPLSAHTQLLRKYTDADIHNVTAYLVTLK
ncbi:MAG: c-type cytochrome [Acidobacteriaceae bacterium]|nr:c-type cytochrome [Acidobacteriaceae bacterium]